MLRFIYNKITKKKKERKPNNAENVAKGLRDKSQIFSEFLSKKFDNIIAESKLIKLKSKNLEETNFKLGRMHIEKGNIKEASFRFFLITKFYPNNYDAKYELSYCYALRKKYAKSQKILEIILKKYPNYSKKALGLLENVKKLQKNS